jgi:Fe-S-cluster-containing dehydrogenase component
MSPKMKNAPSATVKWCRPACRPVPPGAIAFGSLMDPESRVRKLVNDPRAYQVMGYLNTKPAVIYLKKVVHPAPNLEFI